MTVTADDFIEYANLTGLGPEYIEYDWRTGDVVNHIFSSPLLRNRLMLYGGTTLTRVYNVSHRLSSDLDFAYDINTAITSRNLLRRTEINTIKNEFGTKLGQCLPAPYKIDRDSACPTMLMVSYPSMLDNSWYTIMVDFKSGVWHAADNSRPFRTLLPSHDHGRAPNVRAVALGQMMWVKLAVLHCMHNMPVGKTIHPTTSRHYYDTYCMVQSGCVPNPEFRDAVIQTNMMPLQCRVWARFPEMKNQPQLMPAPHIERVLQRDYMDMQHNIQGRRPTWDQIMQTISALQKTI